MNRTVSLREHRQPEHIVCHFDIIHRFSGKVQHRHLYHGRGRAVCGSFVLTVLTVIDHFMHRAALGRLRILRHQHCADPAAPGVRRADLCSQQTAVSADSYFLKSPTAVESHIIQVLVDPAHDLSPQHGTGIASGINHFIRLIAAPHRRAVIGRKSHKITVSGVISSTGLAADTHAGKACLGTGTIGDNILQHIPHQISGSFLHGRVETDLVVNDDFSLGILHLHISPGCGVDAVIDKGTVGRRHLLRGHAIIEAAQSHIAHLLRIRFRQSGKAQLFRHKLIGCVYSVGQIYPHGAGIQRPDDGIAHIGQSAVPPVGVLGPGLSVEENGIVVDG